jgi:hypothetical protein
MSNVRSALLKVYERVPALRPVMVATNRAVKRPTFEGWGMSNQHALPWADDPSWGHFEAAAAAMRTEFEHGLSDETEISSATVDGLRWRHWVVAFAVRYVCAFSEGPVSMVECGVGDGLTAYFACHEAEHLGRAYEFHAYDAWAEVSTAHSEHSYGSLALDRTQRNLSKYHVDYHVGFIPETLAEGAPSSVHYLHLDLNAVAPTKAALEHFLPALAPRAAVLFDDYAHARYEDQRHYVDEFCRTHGGALMKLPTGQAIWFN